MNRTYLTIIAVTTGAFINCTATTKNIDLTGQEQYYRDLYTDPRINIMAYDQQVSSLSRYMMNKQLHCANTPVTPQAVTTPLNRTASSLSSTPQKIVTNPLTTSKPVQPVISTKPQNAVKQATTRPSRPQRITPDRSGSVEYIPNAYQPARTNRRQCVVRTTTPSRTTPPKQVKRGTGLHTQTQQLPAQRSSQPMPRVSKVSY